jgi:4-hydroxy-tetrahydrodipicolinate synthase
VVEIVVQSARGRVPVVAGTGSNSTREAIELTQHAKAAGADGALLISPYYNKPTQEGIYLHYAEIARATSFPLIVYNIPGRTASNVLPATLARLADLPQVVGVKEASCDLAQVADVIARCPEDFCVLAGDDALALPMLAIGGRGVISTISNVAPSAVVGLLRAFRGGDPVEARRAHYRLLPLCQALFCETNPIPLKAALSLMGLCGPEIRLPLTPLGEVHRERLQVVLKELGLLG